MEQNLKELSGHMSLTEEEKLKFESCSMLSDTRKKEFTKNYLTRTVSEIATAHKDDSDSNSDQDVEILKSTKI